MSATSTGRVHRIERQSPNASLPGRCRSAPVSGVPDNAGAASFGQDVTRCRCQVLAEQQVGLEVHNITAWMWGALLATGMAAWLPQLTATATNSPTGHLSGRAHATAKP